MALEPSAPTGSGKPRRRGVLHATRTASVGRRQLGVSLRRWRSEGRLQIRHLFLGPSPDVRRQITPERPFENGQGHRGLIALEIETSQRKVGRRELWVAQNSPLVGLLGGRR